MKLSIQLMFIYFLKVDQFLDLYLIKIKGVNYGIPVTKIRTQLHED